MSGNIYISSPAPTPTTLYQDISLNSVLQGQVSYASPINVNLQDPFGVPILPTSSYLIGNTLNATLTIPNPSGVALLRPNPSQGISYRTFDTGWRAQNGWYDYTPPAYPAAYAQLDSTLGANQWYRLKTPLTLNGVTSTNRFVDLSGVQGWPALNNLNLSVVDKLTGLMFTRTPASSGGGSANWVNQTTTIAPAYSVVINGNTYSDWYLAGQSELFSFWGTYAPLANWVDPFSSLTIMNTNFTRIITADTSSNSAIAAVSYVATWASGGLWSALNTNETTNYYFYVQDVKNLIS